MNRGTKTRELKRRAAHRTHLDGSTGTRSNYQLVAVGQAKLNKRLLYAELVLLPFLVSRESSAVCKEDADRKELNLPKRKGKRRRR